jgi:hypothetical protein
MHWRLWLSQPNTGRILRALVRACGGVCIAWAVLTAYFSWHFDAMLKSEQATIVTHQKRIGDLATGLREKRSQASRALLVKTASPQGVGSAEFADEFTQLCLATGNEPLNIRINGGNQAQAPANAAGANAVVKVSENGQPSTNGGTGGAASPPAASPVSGPEGWAQSKFECEVEGPFLSLLTLLNRLGDSNRMIHITTLHVVRSRIEAQTGQAQIHLQLSGVFFGLPE